MLKIFVYIKYFAVTYKIKTYSQNKDYVIMCKIKDVLSGGVAIEENK